MERVSESVASGMGTVGFVVVSSLIIIGWVLSNHVIHFLSVSWHGLLHGQGFDPAPFILLNLVFSAVAFYTGALVIIAQKAQTRTDQANEEASARHRDELSATQTDLLCQNTDLDQGHPRNGCAAEDADRGGPCGELPGWRRRRLRVSPWTCAACGR